MFELEFNWHVSIDFFVWLFCVILCDFATVFLAGTWDTSPVNI